MSHDLQIWVGLGLLGLFLLLTGIAKLFVKAGPNEALIVYGFRGRRVRTGRGTLIFPLVESSRMLSLELMSFDVAPQQDLYTNQRSEERRVGKESRSQR